MNILIIEDDLFLAKNIAKLFEKKIIINRVKIITNYNHFLKELSIIKSYDIILIDIFLGPLEKKNGIDILSIIREKDSQIPVIIISRFDECKYLEEAFSKGASDYIIKPFRLKELEIRVLKWFKIYLDNDLSKTKNINYFGLEYNISKNEFYYNGIILDLTKGNKYLLLLFLSSPEKLLKEIYLVEKIWGDLSFIIERNLRVNILRLKNKLKKYKIDSWISNIRGEGYILRK
ncbi:MAG: response regulator transcription factor [Candidatus Gracilibacteria bacterium]|nr:response regulator transcription factor [Candidatus Gracilibacteria bacterium]